MSDKTPSETSIQQPAQTPVNIGQESGGEFQQFASETDKSRKERTGASDGH